MCQEVAQPLMHACGPAPHTASGGLTADTGSSYSTFTSGAGPLPSMGKVRVGHCMSLSSTSGCPLSTALTYKADTVLQTTSGCLEIWHRMKWKEPIYCSPLTGCFVLIRKRRQRFEVTHAESSTLLHL